MKHVYLTNGGAEFLKWIALVLMVGDHINKYLFDGALPFLFEAGRVAAPLFTLVFAWNLARPGVAARAHLLSLRLVGLGLVASLPFIALGKLLAGWYPANILFSLACIAALVSLNKLAVSLGMQGRVIARSGCLLAAMVVFVVGGGLVEFWWPLVALGFSGWAYFSRPSLTSAFFVTVSMAGLCLVNQNGWALLAVPLLLFVGRCQVAMPRAKLFFYFFYPSHLAGIWVIRAALPPA